MFCGGKRSGKCVNKDDYFTACERCGELIAAASKKRVIKNRNDQQFWGLEVKEKILCGECLKNLMGQMPTSKKYTFNKHKKRGRL